MISSSRVLSMGRLPTCSTCSSGVCCCRPSWPCTPSCTSTPPLPGHPAAHGHGLPGVILLRWRGVSDAGWRAHLVPGVHVGAVPQEQLHSPSVVPARRLVQRGVAVCRGGLQAGAALQQALDDRGAAVDGSLVQGPPPGVRLQAGAPVRAAPEQAPVPGTSLQPRWRQAGDPAARVGWPRDRPRGLALALMSAPRLTRRVTTSAVSAPPAALCRGVLSSRLCACTAAPASRSSSAFWRCPAAAAQCRAVQPSSSSPSTGAPSCSSRCSSRLPASTAAACSSVLKPCRARGSAGAALGCGGPGGPAARLAQKCTQLVSRLLPLDFCFTK